MAVTLELPLDMEAELTERAAERGQGIQDYFLTLAEEDLYGLAKMSAEEKKETSAILEEELARVHSGDLGMLLEDYRAEVTAEYYRSKGLVPQAPACVLKISAMRSVSPSVPVANLMKRVCVWPKSRT